MASRCFSSYSPADGTHSFDNSTLGLVDPEWLQEHIGKVRVFDATLHLDHSRNAAKEFTEVVIVINCKL